MQFADFPVNALMEITARPAARLRARRGVVALGPRRAQVPRLRPGLGGERLGPLARAGSRDALAAAGRDADQPEPGVLERAERPARAGARRPLAASTGCSSPTAAPRRTKGRSSSRASGAPSTQGGAYEIITFDHAFHGRTLATMSASGKPRLGRAVRAEGARLPEGAAERSRLGRAADRRPDGRGDAGADPGRGRACCRRPTSSCASCARSRAQRGLLLIVDEVQTGDGPHRQAVRLRARRHRAGHHDARQGHRRRRAARRAARASEAVCCFEHGDQGGTYNGNPLMTAVGCAVMEALLAPGFLTACRGARAAARPTGWRTLAAQVRASARCAAAGCCWRSTSGATSARRSSSMRRAKPACCSIRRGRTRCASCRRSTVSAGEIDADARDARRALLRDEQHAGRSSRASATAAGAFGEQRLVALARVAARCGFSRSATSSANSASSSRPAAMQSSAKASIAPK